MRLHHEHRRKIKLNLQSKIIIMDLARCHVLITYKEVGLLVCLLDFFPSKYPGSECSHKLTVKYRHELTIFFFFFSQEILADE